MLFFFFKQKGYLNSEDFIIVTLNISYNVAFGRKTILSIVFSF